MPKVWCIEPTSDKILVRDMEGSVYKETVKKYGWKYAEIKSFTHTNGNNYMLLMNDVGLFEDTDINLCATKFIRRIPLVWGQKILTGSYVICKYADNEDDCNTTYYDMDITPKEFLDGFKKALQKTPEEMEEIFKLFGNQINM